MGLDDVVAEIAPKLLFKLIPEFLALRINLGDTILVLGIGPPHLHADGHDRSSEGATKGPFAPYSSAKPCRQLRKDRIFNAKIILETQGDRFGSVKPLIKIRLCLLRDPFHIVLLCHVCLPYDLKISISIFII
jgi:hypothetical protein